MSSIKLAQFAVSKKHRSMLLLFSYFGDLQKCPAPDGAIHRFLNK
jgi:hypothetical protein